MGDVSAYKSLTKRQSANPTQAALARGIRAAKAAGLRVVRIVVRADGCSIETAGPNEPPIEANAFEQREDIVL